MLERAKVYRNLEYKWKTFGFLDSFDVVASSLTGFIIMCVAPLFGGNSFWGVSIALSIVFVCHILKRGGKWRKFLSFTIFVFQPKKLSACRSEEEVPQFPYRGGMR